MTVLPEKPAGLRSQRLVTLEQAASREEGSGGLGDGDGGGLGGGGLGGGLGGSDGGDGGGRGGLGGGKGGVSTHPHAAYGQLDVYDVLSHWLKGQLVPSVYFCVEADE